MKHIFVVVILGFILIATNFSLQQLNQPVVLFTDVSERLGDTRKQRTDSAELYASMQPYHMMSGGIAVGDYDNDGWLDVYTTKINGPDSLFKNNQDGTFTDIAAEVGLGLDTETNGVAWIDIENDGDLDLYLATAGALKNFLYINEEGQFREMADERSASLFTGETQANYSVAVGDYNNDGYPDLHITEWQRKDREVDPSITSADVKHARLLKNVGEERPGYFVDATIEAGVDTSDSYSFVSNFTDLDNDNYQDLLVVSDFDSTKLFWNNRDGTFTLADKNSTPSTNENDMGLAIADFSTDGMQDVFITSIFDTQETCRNNPDSPACLAPVGSTGNKLYLNQSERSFTDISTETTARDGGWGWAPAIIDFENDGDWDMVQSNDMRMPRMPVFNHISDADIKLWQNDNLTFSDVASSSLVQDVAEGRGIAVFDFDNDGDQDFMVVRNANTPKLYENTTENSGNYLRVGVTNRHGGAIAHGAKIYIQETPESNERLFELHSLTNYLGANEPVAHFGLGSHKGFIHQVRVRWNDGHEEIMSNVPINQLIEFKRD